MGRLEKPVSGMVKSSNPFTVHLQGTTGPASLASLEFVDKFISFCSLLSFPPKKTNSYGHVRHIYIKYHQGFNQIEHTIISLLEKVSNYHSFTDQNKTSKNSFSCVSNTKNKSRTFNFHNNDKKKWCKNWCIFYSCMYKYAQKHRNIDNKIIYRRNSLFKTTNSWDIQQFQNQKPTKFCTFSVGLLFPVPHFAEKGEKKRKKETETQRKEQNIPLADQTHIFSGAAFLQSISHPCASANLKAPFRHHFMLASTCHLPPLPKRAFLFLQQNLTGIGGT